nr:unnamed protein product [Callosobruchus chinensis]
MDKHTSITKKLSKRTLSILDAVQRRAIRLIMELILNLFSVFLSRRVFKQNGKTVQKAKIFMYIHQK